MSGEGHGDLPRRVSPPVGLMSRLDLRASCGGAIGRILWVLNGQDFFAAAVNDCVDHSPAGLLKAKRVETAAGRTQGAGRAAQVQKQLNRRADLNKTAMNS